MSDSTNTDQPSLVGGHAQYIKSQAEAAVGSITGSAEWKASAEQDKQQAVDSMKAASANRDHQQQGYGKVEEIAGKAVGCEGMETEGAATKKPGQ
ncbi:hypothetical protein DOTSEDRAFT_121292 [Dothistroma septosporum NZE10]|uniref:Uncharacterized protein n=1 Tax=Dothistroma septosporum (strain NZE10 / CBS 128990) TaxID=675120 RepID=N1Q252_DOTSN|nr:hypothetical protein DOTSEDRAFT_121292 [Dothistroma septosporum NZE10]